MSEEIPVSLACAVLTVSDTRSAGDDTSGNLLAHNLAHAGHQCVRRDIVRDDIYQIRRVISDWIADPEVQVILTSGGTGFSHRDHTPAAILPLLDREIPGIMEAVRRAGAAKTPLAALSRGYAGAAGSTFIINLPGSPKGVMDGLTVLDPVIGHLCDQLEGGHGH